MARPLRIEYPGAVYHITSRGNARQDIFLEAADQESFLDILATVVTRFQWLCHAYCLMNNHYHLLIETPAPNLSRGMRQLNGNYTQRFNQAHYRVGHLFQGRYKAVLVEKECYLVELCRYIVLNPVRAGAIQTAGDWPWSSYRATAGILSAPDFLTIDWILGQFDAEKGKAQKLYRQFVGVGAESPWPGLSGQIFLGGVDFVARFVDILREAETMKEVPRYQRYAVRPELAEIFERSKGERVARDKAIHRAYTKFGYTLAEIGDYLGLHYTTISKALKRFAAKSL